MFTHITIKLSMLIALLGLNLSLLGVLYDSQGLAIFNAYGSHNVEYLQQMSGSGADDDVALFAIFLVNIPIWLALCLTCQRQILGSILTLGLILQQFCLMWIETDSAYRILSDTLFHTHNPYLWIAFGCECILIGLAIWNLFTLPHD